MQRLFYALLLALLPVSGIALAQAIESVEYTEPMVFTIQPRLFPETRYYSRPRTIPIDTVVWHNVCLPSAIDTVVHACSGDDRYDPEGIMRLLRENLVSAHYLIDRDGIIYQLVREERVAYHAGRSYLEATGRSGYNDFSLGIEIINNTEDRPTEAQYQALEWLMADIRSRHAIVEKRGHGEIAGDRRSDPYNFDWERAAHW